MIYFTTEYKSGDHDKMSYCGWLQRAKVATSLVMKKCQEPALKGLQTIKNHPIIYSVPINLQALIYK